jgi:hypothetical protein
VPATRSVLAFVVVVTLVVELRSDVVLDSDWA